MRLGALLVAIFLVGSLNVADGGDRPNVIVVMADDISARDFPIYGSSNCYGERASTPVIDRLAKEGCYLTTAWSSTVCMPTRAMVMSGRYAHLTKWWDNGEFGKAKRGGIYEVAVSSPLTIGHVAKQAGCRSIWVGKTHVTTGSSYTKFAFDEGVFTPGEPDVRGTSPYDHFKNVNSLLPVFADPSLPGKQAALSKSPRRGGMGYSIRSGNWRYKRWQQKDCKVVARELYDHSQSDVARNNVVDRIENVNTVKQHDELLLEIVSQ